MELADLGIRSVERETVRDIAVRMRKMALLDVIEEACKYVCMFPLRTTALFN